MLGIVGPNGAGKSTLVGMLAGETSPSSGEILLSGEPISGYRPLELANLRAVLPQTTVLQFAFRVLDVVMMGSYGILGWIKRPGKREKDSAIDALGKVGMTEFADRQISQLWFSVVIFRRKLLLRL